MGDEDHGARKRHERVGENIHRGGVEVIRRLVQQESIRRLDEHPGQGHAVAFAAAQHLDQLFLIRAFEQECAGDGADEVHVGTVVRFRDGLQHGVLGVQDIGLVLGEVVEGRAVADRPDAGIGWEDARQHLEQGTLAGAVFAHQGDALAALHCEIERSIDDVVAIGLGDALKLQHMPAGGGRDGKSEAHALGIAGPFDPLDFLQLLEAGLHLASPGGLIPEPVHELLHARDLLVLAVGGDLLRRLVRLPPGEVLRVVARGL